MPSSMSRVAAAVVLSTRHFYQNRARPSSAQESLGAGPSPPKLLVRRQFFSWRDVESTDYPTYIANLRDIGCPEQTIRDIIIADINAMYSRRRALEVVTAGQQWWRAEPDSNVVAVAAEKTRALARFFEVVTEVRQSLREDTGLGDDRTRPGGSITP